MRYLIALLAVAGMVVSYLALRVHYSTESAPCSINEKWDCGIVNHSPYAEIRGMRLTYEAPFLRHFTAHLEPLEAVSVSV